VGCVANEDRRKLWWGDFITLLYCTYHIKVQRFTVRDSQIYSPRATRIWFSLENYVITLTFFRETLYTRLNCSNFCNLLIYIWKIEYWWRQNILKSSLKRIFLYCWNLIVLQNLTRCTDWDKATVKFAARSDDILIYALQKRKQFSLVYSLSWRKKKGLRPVGLCFRPVGLRFRPVGLRFRPVGLRSF